LIRKTEVVKKLTNIFSIVRNFPFFEDEIGNDSRSPAISLIAGGDGWEKEKLREFPLFLRFRNHVK
jgi:hypothetical protein